MKIEVEHGQIGKAKDDLAVLFCTEFEKKKSPFHNSSEPMHQLLTEAIDDSDFKGEDKKSLLCYTFKKVPAKRIIIVGLGKKEKIDLETIRKACSIGISAAKSVKAKNVAFCFPETELEVYESTSAIVEGITLTNYSFDKYKTEEKKDKVAIEVCRIFANKDLNKIKEQIKESVVICNNVASCRNIINENANIIYPENFARIAKQMKGVKVKVLDDTQIRKLGMGLLNAVGMGSKYPPRFVAIEYNGNPKSNKRIALVGKGITYDTGGYNLKPTGFMETMRCDMSGAACVMYTIKALSELKIKQNVVGLMPLAENVVSDRSYKPGDTFVSYSGKSVEIGNTDAEGRLILADAIAYSKNYKPDMLIDLATLTGACVVALGPNIAGLFTEDEELCLRLIKSGQQTFDRVWRLPMYDEIREDIKSDIADIKNSGASRYAGAIQGAVFLQKFLPEKVKWAHIDIAGPAFLDKPNYYNPKNATGFGVRLLVQFFKDLK